MNLRTFIILPLVIFLGGCAHLTEADGARRPKTDMATAISIARSYIKSHQIDVSEQFLSSVVSFHDVYKPETGLVHFEQALQDGVVVVLHTWREVH